MMSFGGLLVSLPLILSCLQQAANPVNNPGFESSAEEPIGWQRAYTSLYFEGQVSDIAHSGAHSLFLQDHSGVTWGFFRQFVRLESNKQYRVRAWVRVDGGRAVMWVQDADANGATLGQSVNQRAYLDSLEYEPLVPGFLSRQQARGDLDWHLMEMTVNLKEPAKGLAIRLGSYFAPSRIWFDDITVTAVPESEGSESNN